MEEQKKRLKAVAILIIPVILVIAVLIIAKQFMPSKERLELTEYYSVEKDEILLLMQDEIYDKKGRFVDGMAYIDFDTVVTYLNKRFYWDANENILIYTTATQVLKAEVGNKYYYVNKSKVETTYQPVKIVGETVYVALDYIKLHSNITAENYENPNRIVLTYKWGEKYKESSVKKDTSLRQEASIKSPIIYDLKQGDKVVLLADETDTLADSKDQKNKEQTKKAEGETTKDQSKKEKKNSKFSKVITKDGIIGYAENKRLADAKEKKLVSEIAEEVYPSITKDYKINMVWHQVMNMDANELLLNLLDDTKGVTTLSPTWFSIANNNGEIRSLASETYVSRAHSADVEVWALCDDFDKNVSPLEVLSHTSKREKLEKELIAAAIKYNLDGINIDFERINDNSAIHFIQFIRELSVKCRSNGIVLSVDNYAPGYTGYYDRKEQGIVADYVVTMAYDEHNGSSKESGPVASIGYVEDAIKNTLKEVPKEKMIVGIPFYTRLWKEVQKEEEVTVTSEAYAMTRAANHLKDNGVEVVWDKSTGQNYGEYKKDGAKYRMWLEDAMSVELKMKAIAEADVAGVAGWKLSLESENIWDVVIKYTN